MNKELAIRDAKRNYDEALARIEFAYKLCLKVDSLLPKEWESCIFGEHLEFHPKFSHKSPPAEFRMVCDLIEKAVGVKTNRRASGKKGYEKLVGSIFYYKDNFSISIWVESMTDDSCKITYKRNWEIKPIADERCLGIRQ